MPYWGWYDRSQWDEVNRDDLCNGATNAMDNVLAKLVSNRGGTNVHW